MLELLTQYGDEILAGLLGTVMIVGGGTLMGGAVGVALAFPLASGVRMRAAPVRVYVELIRNTPFLIQAMLLFAVLGVLRIRVDPMLVGGAAVAVYTAAYMAEIVRGALKSIPAGQYDAANALGLKKVQRFRLVIYPQLLPFALPASVNLVGTITKESAFLSAVSVAELTFSGQVIIAQTFKVFEVWTIVGILYLILVLTILAAANRLEARLAWSRFG